ncbi:MAG TPA: citrate/2-methylcitrate synthase [Nitrospiraceae bacterium]|nr:citrate/2-methylcitrate synthase [Nitrospiraceae bacterium]
MKRTDEKTYSPGLEGVLAGESEICQVDEGDSGLRYRGYAIGDLAEGASFEEVAYLLLFGALPTQQQLKQFVDHIAEASILPKPVEDFIHHIPSGAHPMDILRTGVSVLGMADPEAGDHSHDVNLRKAVRLLAQIPLLITSAYRHIHGKQSIESKTEGGYADHLLFLLTERRGDERARAMARLLNVSLILYAEHEFNASTFAARVTASTMTDLHSAITAAIGTLKGPLHGGANEAVAAMFCEIAAPDRAERWVRDALASKRRVMGFGHRVLKQGDPRSLIIQRQARALSRICGDTRWYEMATTIDRIMQEEKALYPNLDFYTAVSYLLMGIPRDWYTPVFVCSRITGWCAHVIEQQDHNRLIRPRALYTGPPLQAYVAIARRA